jgi:hypothetical protein
MLQPQTQVWMFAARVLTAALKDLAQMLFCLSVHFLERLGFDDLKKN